MHYNRRDKHNHNIFHLLLVILLFMCCVSHTYIDDDNNSAGILICSSYKLLLINQFVGWCFFLYVIVFYCKLHILV